MDLGSLVYAVCANLAELPLGDKRSVNFRGP